MLLLVAIISHSAGDTGYVLVIPLGGIIFQAAGRHPLAGIACAARSIHHPAQTRPRTQELRPRCATVNRR